MLAILTFLVLLWVLRQPMSLSLGAYFAAQLLCLPVLELSWRFIGPGKTYGWIYTLATGLVFAAIGNLVWEGLRTARYKARAIAIAFILAVAFTRMAFLGLPHAPGWADWLLLGEGGLLVAAGVLEGANAPYTHWPDISLSLSALWFSQALLAFGYSIHFPAWNLFDLYARTAVGMLGFAFIGLRLHQRRHRGLKVAGSPHAQS